MLHTTLMKMLRKYFLAGLVSIVSLAIMAQAPVTDVSAMTRDEVLAIPYERLIEMPLDQLLQLADIVGVSLDELYEMILNKNIVAASKKEESSFDSPLSSTVLSGDEIRRSGATSIPEALRLVPGIIVREKTPGNYDVHIRGNDNVPPNHMFLYSENSISLVMIDNMPVYNTGHGGTFWEVFPIDVNDVERIEVIRGPSSALYGPNAASGAINIVTIRPEDNKPKIDFDAQGGTPTTALVNGGVGFGLGSKFKARVSGNYQYRERWDDRFYLWNEAPGYGDGYYHLTDTVYNILSPTSHEYGDPLDTIVDNPSLGLQKYGVNAFLFYEMNKDACFSLMASNQGSYTLATIVGDKDTPLTERLSNSSYVNFRAKTYGFTTQLSYNWGAHDVQTTSVGLKHDISDFYGSVEYQYQLGKLVVRPGVAYQHSVYDDSPYAGNDAGMEVLFNRPVTISNIAASLRAEYTLFEKLRLIGAVRQDWFQQPEISKTSFQAIGSYKINEKNLVRAVYSRAYRGPFMADTYTDYKYMKSPYTMVNFKGSNEVDLLKIDMVEVGYRTKPFKTVQAELEAFYITGEGYGYYGVDGLIGRKPLDSIGYSPSQVPALIPTNITLKYNNLDLKSEQYGVTLNVKWVACQKLIIGINQTLQYTRLSNYYINSVSDEVTYQFSNNSRPVALNANDFIVYNANREPIDTLYTATLIANINRPDSLYQTIDHKATPAWYGGLTVDYRPIEKLSIVAGGYYYGKQTFVNMNGTDEIDSKLLVNLKVSYQVWKYGTVYLNARNLLNDDHHEYGFTDPIGGLYMVGATLNF